jgi:Immunity protein 8
MRAELKRLHSPDVDLESFSPEQPENFGFLVQAMVGPEGEDVEESFDFQICTPEWLRPRLAEQGTMFGRFLIIVAGYNLTDVSSAIRSLRKMGV